jgi:hypothetical protein
MKPTLLDKHTLSKYLGTCITTVISAAILDMCTSSILTPAYSLSPLESLLETGFEYLSVKLLPDAPK